MIIVQYYFFTIILLAVSARSDRSRTSAQTSDQNRCPRRCTCTTNKIECTDLNLRGHIFDRIRQSYFPELDTLVLSGNDLGDLSTNIFDEGSVHSSLSLINLTDNGITKLSKKTFENVPNLEYLTLKNNKIISAGKSTFRHNQRLRELDLTNALGDRDAASKADLLSLMFESDEKDSLTELSTLKLGSNSISTLHKSTFCKISGLVHLDLSNNDLADFTIAANCLKPLKALILSGNKFVTIPVSMWDSFPVTSLDISGNPLNCDCDLEPFHKIARAENTDFVNQGLTFCAAPAKLKGKNFFDTTDNFCESSGWGFGTFFLLALIGAAALFAYRHYRRKQPVVMPFHFGYSGLDMEEEVQPEFV